jgi:hypothetical protein
LLLYSGPKQFTYLDPEDGSNNLNKVYELNSFLEKPETTKEKHFTTNNLLLILIKQ